MSLCKCTLDLLSDAAATRRWRISATDRACSGSGSRVRCWNLAGCRSVGGCGVNIGVLVRVCGAGGLGVDSCGIRVCGHGDSCVQALVDVGFLWLINEPIYVNIW